MSLLVGRCPALASSLQSSRYCSLTTRQAKTLSIRRRPASPMAAQRSGAASKSPRAFSSGGMVEHHAQAAQSHGAVVVLQSQAEAAIQRIGLGLHSAAGLGMAPASRCCHAAPGLDSRSSRLPPQASCWPWLRARSAQRFPASCRRENRTGLQLLRPAFCRSSLAAVSPPSRRSFRRGKRCASWS